MGLQLGQNGEMAILLKVKDDGSVVVEKFADNTEKDLGKTSKAAKKASTDWKKMGKQIAAAALVATTALAFLVTSSANAADQSAKTADKIGTTVEALTELRYAAELTGVAQNTLDMGLQRMTRRVASAAGGATTYQKALKDLGLDYVALAKLAPDQQFAKIAGAMKNVQDEGEKIRLTFALFDSEGVALKNTLALGEKGLAKYGNEARRVGAVLTTETARASEYFNDNLTRLKATGTGLSNALLAELLPTLNTLTDAMVSSATEGESFKTFVSGVGTVFDSLVTAGIAVSTTFEVVGKSIGAAAAFVALAVQGKFGQAVDVYKQHEEALRETATNSADLISKIWAGSGGPPAANDDAAAAASAGGGGGGQPQGEDPKVAQLRESLAAQVDTMRQSYLSESELLLEKYANEQFLLEDALETKAITQAEHQESMMQSNAEYQQRMAEIDAQGQSQQYKQWQSSLNGKLQVTSGVLSQVSNLMQSENKKQFEIGKKAAMAQTVIDTYTGAVSAYKALAGIPIVGPALGIAAAAAVVLYGKTQYDRIHSQQFGAGSGAVGTYPANPNTGVPVSSSGPGAVASPGSPAAIQANQPQQQQQAPQKMVLVLRGSDVFTAEALADQLIPKLNQLAKKGIQIEVSYAA